METPERPVARIGRRNVEDGVPVHFAHDGGLLDPVRRGVLDYAEGVDPDVAMAEAAGDGDGFEEGVGEGGEG